MDFSKYLFRSHMVGKIINVPKPLTSNQTETFEAFNKKGYENLTERQKETFASLKTKHDQSKTFKLSEANKKVLSSLAFAERYGRKTELNSAPITKGLEVEKKNRDTLTRISGIILSPCKERKQNEWVTGLLDIEPNNLIIDIKSSFSWESYSRILEASTDETYLRQLDSYMDLWGIKDSLLCHVLTDTPGYIIDKVLRSYDYTNDVLNVEGEVREECIDQVKQIITNHIFSREGLEAFCLASPIVHIEWFNDFVEIPESERVHMIPHSYDPTRIEQRNECIVLAREYMNKVKSINNYKPELIN